MYNVASSMKYIQVSQQQQKLADKIATKSKQREEIKTFVQCSEYHFTTLRSFFLFSMYDHHEQNFLFFFLI